jgi:hypothetical protein
MEPSDVSSTLPEELVDIIADYSNEHILALRQTCSQMHHKSRRVFLRKYISTRHVWIDQFALQRLISLSEDEQLGQHVRRLIIHLSAWDSEAAQKKWDEGGLVTVEKLRALENAHEKASAQEYIMDSGSASKLLCQSMKAVCPTTRPNRVSNL